MELPIVVDAAILQHGLPSVGIMVETPAAAVNSQNVLAGLDFASIGTNDLAQYTMAVDRLQGPLASLLSPWQPAVLHMIRATCHGGAAAGVKIGVCGEAAGDPLLAIILVGLGVSSLSMSTTKIPAVRMALSRHTFQQCQQIADRVLDMATSDAARAAALEEVDRELGALVTH